MKILQNWNSLMCRTCSVDFIRYLTKYCTNVYMYGDCVTSILTGKKYVDLDLVIECKDKASINWLLSKYSTTVNNFGGTRFSDGINKYDLWYLDQSKNLTDYGFEIKVNNLLKACLFNNQSIYYDVCRGRVVYGKSWETFIERNLLDYVTTNTLDLSKFASKASSIQTKYKVDTSIRLQKLINRIRGKK